MRLVAHERSGAVDVEEFTPMRTKRRTLTLILTSRMPRLLNVGGSETDRRSNITNRKGNREESSPRP